MGSLQEELKKLESLTASPKPQQPEPSVVMQEQRKLAGIAATPESKPQQISEDTQDWRLGRYAQSISNLCEELEQRLNSTLKGLEQYKTLDPKETGLKPGRSLKDLKGAAKELQSKLIQARRIASNVESELKP